MRVELDLMGKWGSGYVDTGSVEVHLRRFGHTLPHVDVVFGSYVELLDEDQEPLRIGGEESARIGLSPNQLRELVRQGQIALSEFASQPGPGLNPSDIDDGAEQLVERENILIRLLADGIEPGQLAGVIQEAAAIRQGWEREAEADD